jgi:hypothetical protein
LAHDILRAASRADCTAGNNREIRMLIMVMTVSSSTSVNAPCGRDEGIRVCMTISLPNRDSMDNTYAVKGNGFEGDSANVSPLLNANGINSS